MSYVYQTRANLTATAATVVCEEIVIFSFTGECELPHIPDYQIREAELSRALVYS